MKKVLKFIKEYGVFAIAAVLFALIFIVGVMVALTSCSAKEVDEDVKAVEEEAYKLPDTVKHKVGSKGHSIVIDPKEDISDKGFFAAKDLGSHVLYVTHPKVDEALKEQMDKYHMDVVEVYFREDEGADALELTGEPVASAVFYFFEDSAKEVTISWWEIEEGDILVNGVHMDDPAYVMKYTMAGRADNPEAVDWLLIEDYTGGHALFQNMKDSYFGIDRLSIKTDTSNSVL